MEPPTSRHAGREDLSEGDICMKHEEAELARRNMQGNMQVSLH